MNRGTRFQVQVHESSRSFLFTLCHFMFVQLSSLFVYLSNLTGVQTKSGGVPFEKKCTTLDPIMLTTCIYLSRAVGTQPKATEENILQVLKDWKTFGVSGGFSN